MDRSLLTLLAFVFLASQAAADEKPALIQKIDEIIQKRLNEAKIPASAQADDAEFVRRVYLDITGRIPTMDQARAFLDDQDPDKRAKLIDELLGRLEYGLHFATIWRELLVDRSPDKSQVRGTYSWAFIDWLADGLNKGRGWNEIVADILTAEGEAAKNPATTFLLTNRMGVFPRPEDMVGMAGRLFMGIQLRCAQCHDHPYVKEWHQDDFWGVAAFFSQVRDHTTDQNGGSRNPTFSERPNPDQKLETSYINRLKRAGFIAPPAGPQAAIPQLGDPSQTLRVVKAKLFLADAPELPEGPYRPRFATWLTAADNPYFARAAVNRTWAHFFGSGLVNPVDDMRPDRAATHPEVVDLLEKEFKSNGFDTKHLIRVICNSQAYQRTSRPLPENKEDRELLSHMAMKVMSPDQTIDSLAIAVGRAPTVGKNRDQGTALFATKEADGSPTDFSHGIPQFLYQMNTGPAGSPPNILGKLTAGKSKEDVVQAMYLTVLTRSARPAELKRMLAYLDQATDANQGYRDVYWVLLNSAEFILNH